jgi:hypothetical protein
LRSFRKRTTGVVVYPLREILDRDVCFSAVDECKEKALLQSGGITKV